MADFLKILDGEALANISVQFDYKSATADFVSGLMKAIPPMNEMFDMAGMTLPKYLGEAKAETPAAAEAPVDPVE